MLRACHKCRTARLPSCKGSGDVLPEPDRLDAHTARLELSSHREYLVVHLHEPIRQLRIALGGYASIGYAPHARTLMLHYTPARIREPRVYAEYDSAHETFFLYCHYSSTFVWYPQYESLERMTVITIQDIIKLPVFDSIWLVCPCAGCMDRPVTNCGTLDYEPFFDDYNAFVPGEFIFTTLGFAQADPKLAEDAILKVIERGIAALAIKPVALKEVSERIAAASEASGVPIFFYEGRYIERTMTEVMNLIDRDKEASKQTALIDALLAPSDAAAVRSNIFQITNATGVAIQCIAAVPEHTSDAASLRALKGQLGALLDEYALRFPDVESCTTTLYHDAVLGFISFSRKPQTVITIAEADLCMLASQIPGMVSGLSQEMPLDEGDLCIRQAIGALGTARDRKESTVRWSELRLDAFHTAAASDRLFARASRHIYDLLDEHDRTHGSELRATADAYAASFGDVKATAEELIQHPNTVRYRVKKVKEALGSESLTDKELVAVLIMARIAQERI